MRVASLAFALFVFWVLLSGHYTAFLLGAGALSAIAIAYAGRIFGYADREGHPVELILSGVRYWPWLVVEIAKSALAVSRIILTPSLPIGPQIVRLKAGPETAVGMATLANSITLTPGTISIDTDRHHHWIVVHALTGDGVAGLEEGDMDRRVARFEKRRDRRQAAVRLPARGASRLMLAAALLGILVAAALMLFRALRGPTIFDRLVAANSIGNAAIVFLAVLGFFNGRPDFLDIALAYALLNVVGVFAVLKFFRYGPLGGSGEEGGHMSIAEIVALAGSAIAVLGSLFMVIGAAGVIRMPDVFTRLHAASVADTFGVTLVLVGLILVGGLSLVSVKLAFLIAFLFLTGPVATHAVARAALDAGVKPLDARGKPLKDTTGAGAKEPKRQKKGGKP